MALAQLHDACQRCFWGVLILLSLSSCSAAYRFQYQYTLVAPAESPGGVVEDARVRLRVHPTAEVGVLQLAVTNKSAQPIAIVWAQSYYIDPLGRARRAIGAEAQGFVRAPGASVTDTRIASGAEVFTTVRAFGVPSTLPSRLWRDPEPSDPRIPLEEEFHATALPTGSATYNPFTVSRYAGGEVVVSSTPPPFVPATGDTPTLGQAYEGREFRFVLALRLDTGITPYTFTFQITDVEVQ
jgi:hypothetical protein